MMCIKEIICFHKAADDLVHVRNIRVIEQRKTPPSEYYKIQACNIYYFYFISIPVRRREKHFGAVLS